MILLAALHTKGRGYGGENGNDETKEGQAIETEIMLSVVDLGVLNLIGYRTPNWFNTFYGARPLSVASADTRIHLIGQRNYGEKGDIPGGDGIFESKNMLAKAAADMGMDIFSIRKNFLSTAFYQGRVKTDTDGKASIMLINIQIQMV